MFFVLALIALMLIITALYVSAEFATVSVRKTSIQQMAIEGNATAKALLPYLEDGKKLDQYVATCQIGITLASIILGAVGQSALGAKVVPALIAVSGLSEETARSITAICVLIALTALQMVLGELVPKSLSLQFPNRVALLTFKPMKWSMGFFSWFIYILNGSGVWMLNAMGFKQSEHRHIHSPQELEILIAESRDGGVLEPDEHQRLKKALALSSKKTEEILIPRTRMVAIDVRTPADKVLKIIEASPYTRMPVFEGTTDNVIGMLHAKDIISRYLQQGRVSSIKDLLRPLPAVPANLTADRLMKLLKKRRAHIATVIDEFGGVDGIVTLEDVLREVMGPVGDEFKKQAPEPETLPDGRVRLPGSMHLDDAEQWLGVLWEGDSNTIAGKIMENFGAIPSAGTAMVIDGVEIVVERVEHNTVTLVSAKPASRTEAEEGDSFGS